MPCRIPEEQGDRERYVEILVQLSLLVKHTHTHWYTPQCVQKPLHAVGRLLFQHLDAALHLPDTKTTQGVRERSAASGQRISCCSHTDSKTHICNSKWPHLPVSCWAAVIHEKRHVFIRYLTRAERRSIKGFLLLGLFDLNGFISLWRLKYEVLYKKKLQLQKLGGEKSS